MKGISKMHTIVQGEGKMRIREKSCSKRCCFPEFAKFTKGCRGWFHTGLSIQDEDDIPLLTQMNMVALGNEEEMEQNIETIDEDDEDVPLAKLCNLWQSYGGYLK